MPRSNENKSCVRADWILLVKRAETAINSDQNFNQLKVDKSTEPSVVESVFKLGDAQPSSIATTMREAVKRDLTRSRVATATYSHPRINGDLV